MKKSLSLIIFALFLASVNAFISTDDALRIVSVENSFIREGELTEFNPNVTISFNEKEYWVIGIFKGTTQAGFVAVLDAEIPLIPEEKSINRNLFNVSFVLGNFLKTKKRLTDQAQWFFTEKNADDFRTLGRFLQNEKTDLELIKGEVSEKAILNEIAEMRNSLDFLISQSDEISADITRIINFETSFQNNPSGEELTEFISNFTLDDKETSSVLFKLNKLKEEAIEYDAKVTKLQSLISNTDLDSSKKSQFIAFARAPQQLYALSSYSNVASNNKQSLDSIFNSVDTQVTTFLSNLDTRFEMNNAGKLLFKENESISKASGSENIASLEQAFQDIIETDKQKYWTDQENVSVLELNFNKAKLDFDRGNFSSSIVFSNQAIDSARKVYSKGLEIPEQEDLLTPLLQNITIALIALLVLLFLYNNRGRIKGLISRKKEEETMEEGLPFE